MSAVKAAHINQAVDQMYYIMESGNSRSAIRGKMLAEVRHIQLLVEEMGGMLWSNPWLGDVTLGDVAIPQDWHRRGGTLTLVRTWPRVQAGDIITHDGKRLQVVVNFVHVSTSDLCAKAFSVYAITRYYRF